MVVRVTQQSDFANLPMIELRQFYDIGLEKIRMTNVKRSHQMLIKAMFKFIDLSFFQYYHVITSILNKSDSWKRSAMLWWQETFACWLLQQQYSCNLSWLQSFFSRYCLECNISTFLGAVTEIRRFTITTVWSLLYRLYSYYAPVVMPYSPNSDHKLLSITPSFGYFRQ